MVRLFMNDVFSIKRIARSPIYICSPLYTYYFLNIGDSFYLHHFNYIYKYTIIDYNSGVYFCRRKFTFKRYKKCETKAL